MKRTRSVPAGDVTHDGTADPMPSATVAKNAIITRIRVTNLPPDVTEASLRTYFQPYGDVTDCAVLRSKKNNSTPRMAFVGFKKASMAKEAVRKANGTYFHSPSHSATTRLVVDLARPVEPNPKGITPTSVDTQPPPIEVIRPPTAEQPLATSFETFKHIVSGGGGGGAKNRGWRDDVAQVVSSASDPTVEAQTTTPDNVDDAAFLRSKMVPSSSTEPLTVADTFNSNTKPSVTTERIFVRNLPFSTTEDELRALCARHGTIVDIHIPKTLDTKASKGVAIIKYQRPREAQKAIETLHGRMFQGRILGVEEAQEEPAKPEKGHKSKAEKNKPFVAASTKGNAVGGFSPLYMDTNTIATTMANKLKVDKGVLLGAQGQDSNNVAIRTAVAEAVLTTELKDMLSQEGINVEACYSTLRGGVKTNVPRSNTVILVKNVTAAVASSQQQEAALHELKSVFEAIGPIDRIALPTPPAGSGGALIAPVVIVRFLHPEDAQAAMKKLSFRALRSGGGVPLFLEWAPVDAMLGAASGVMRADEDGEGAVEEDEEDDLDSGLLSQTIRVINISNLM
eukprot:PhF_6_TR13414/c2_g1_i7/m.21365/K14787/MRD1, RBM19; multiple RNA-binding domain-containing protein 1